MRRLIDVYPYNCRPHPHKGNSLKHTERYLQNVWGRPTAVVSSGRVGVYEIVNFLALTRQDHIMVPDFMCQAVLNVLNKNSFPVQTPTKQTRAILLFHQWGYPQNMQKVLPEIKKRGLFVIEDNANSFDSRYDGQTIGTFGDAAMYSFPKLFPTYIGGAVASRDSELIDFVKSRRDERRGAANIAFNILATHVIKKNFETKKPQFLLDALYLKSIAYPNISKHALKRFSEDEAALKKILAQRKNIYEELKKRIPKEYLIPDRDASINPNPFALPLFASVQKLERIQKELREQEILADILHFDINRNMFDPNYQKCLALPCHQYVSKEHILNIEKVIRES